MNIEISSNPKKERIRIDPFTGQILSQSGEGLTNFKPSQETIDPKLIAEAYKKSGEKKE